MIETVDGKILLGAIAGKGGIKRDLAFMLLLDSNGKKINYNPFPYLSDSSEQIDHLGQLQNGDFVIESSANNNYYYFYTLADPTGKILRRWEFDGAFHNGTGGFVVDGDSIVVFSSIGLLSGPLSLEKFDTGFNKIWIKYYDDTADFYNGAQQIFRTTDNGLLLVANRDENSDELGSDVVLIKLDSQGNLVKADYSGIKGIAANCNFSIYPNPATDYLYINVPNTNDLIIDILDSRGEKVLSVPQSNTGIEKIDVHTLADGLYLYRLYNESGVCGQGKFVKE